MALQFEITDAAGVAVLDISNIAFDKKYTPRLNLPWTASCRVPTDQLSILNLVGDHRLKVRDGGVIKFNGIIWVDGDDGDEDTVWTELTAIDAQGAFFPRRPARDTTGDFSKPNFLTAFTTAPQIFQSILANSVTNEGTMGISSGTFATGGVNVSGVPVDWPMTLADILALLTGTGEFDLIPTPRDTTDGLSITLDGYNGNFGTDLTASVHFDYGTGLYNARALRRTRSMDTICNKLWYYLGPRVLKASDPAGDQHWSGNITATGMPDGLPGPGGMPLPDPPQTAINALIAASRASYGVFMDIRIFDGDGENSVANLYGRLWQTEAQLRAVPRSMMYVTPVRGTSPTFHIGDLITMNAGAVYRGGFTNAQQRVYSYTVAEDDDGVIEVIDITTSADQG